MHQAMHGPACPPINQNTILTPPNLYPTALHDTAAHQSLNQSYQSNNLWPEQQNKTSFFDQIRLITSLPLHFFHACKAWLISNLDSQLMHAIWVMCQQSLAEREQDLSETGLWLRYKFDSVLQSHDLNNKLFNDQTGLDHLNTTLISNSDPHST